VGSMPTWCKSSSPVARVRCDQDDVDAAHAHGGRNRHRTGWAEAYAQASSLSPMISTRIDRVAGIRQSAPKSSLSGARTAMKQIRTAMGSQIGTPGQAFSTCCRFRWSTMSEHCREGTAAGIVGGTAITTGKSSKGCHGPTRQPNRRIAGAYTAQGTQLLAEPCRRRHRPSSCPPWRSPGTAWPISATRVGKAWGWRRGQKAVLALLA